LLLLEARRLELLLDKYQMIVNNTSWSLLRGAKVKRVGLGSPSSMKGLLAFANASALEWVTLEFHSRDGDGEKERPRRSAKLELFAKRPMGSGGRARLSYAAMVADWHRREVGFYNLVVRDLREFVQNNNSGAAVGLDFLPECLHADEEVILLKSLAEADGYYMPHATNGRYQDLQHARMSMETYAKFHAVSYAMIQERFGGKKSQVLASYPCLEDHRAKDEMQVRVFELARSVVIQLLNVNTFIMNLFTN